MRLVVVIAALVSLTATVAQASDLKVVVDGVRSGKGAIMVALFNDASAFAADARFAGAFVTAKPGRVVVAFPELEPGTYAVSAFHDENDNDELDANFLGVPTEGYGFSNEAKGLFGPPDFAAASVVLKDRHMSITLELTY